MKKITITIIAITLILFMYSCSSQEQSKTLEMKNVRLAVSTQPSNCLVLIALEQGYFKKHGLSVEISEFPSGKRALLNGLLADKADVVASTTDVPFVFGVLAGKEIVTFASIFSASNVNSIIARKDRGIEKPEDLKNKRIGTQKASAVHFFLNLFLTKYNISEEDVEIKYYKAENLPDAIAKGEIDAFSMREPYISRAKNLLQDNAVVFQVPGLYRQNELVLAKKDYVSSNSEIVSHFMEALYESKRLIKENPEAAKEILAKKLNITVESVNSFWGKMDHSITLAQSSLLLMEHIARWALSNNLVENGKMKNFLDYINIEALKNIDPEAVTIVH